MRTDTTTILVMLAVLVLAGVELGESQTRVPRASDGVRSGASGGGASATRPSTGSRGSSSSGQSRSKAGGGTAYRPPSRGSRGSAGVSRRHMSGSSTRPGTPIYRPPSVGHRPPGYRPPYPIYGYPPHWGWGYWGWPYRYSYGFWGWPYDWGAWSHAYPAPAPYMEVWRQRPEPPSRGGLDLKVKPRSTQVWIDGEYAGLARDFDGFPSYLWLGSGSHEVSFYLPGYETVTRGVEVYPGRVGELKMKLSRGESGLPPGP